MLKRDNFIINRLTKNYIVASFLGAISVTLVQFVDGIMLGNFIDPAALSVLNIMLPIEVFFSALKIMLVSGAVIHVARFFGQRAFDKANAAYTVSFFSNVLITTAIVAILYFCLPLIIPLLCPNPTILPFVQQYVPVIIWVYPINAVIKSNNAFIRLSGRPDIVSWAAILGCALNAIADFVLLYFFHLGIAAVAWSSIVCISLSRLIFIPYVHSPQYQFHFVRVKASRALAFFRDNIKLGFPNSLNDFFTAITFSFLNSLILSGWGANGMFVWAVVMQLFAICRIVGSSYTDALQHLGGILIGESDSVGFRMLVRGTFIRLFAAVFLFAAICCLFPHLVLALFGADDAIISQSVHAFRLCSLLLPPAMLAIFFSQLVVIFKYVVYASAISIFSNASILLTTCICYFLAPQAFWWAIPASYCFILAVLLVVNRVISFRNPTLSPISLLPNFPDKVSASFSIRYDVEDISQAIDAFTKFIDICEAQPDLSYKIRLCSEELMLNILEEGKKYHHANDFFDMRILYDDNSIDIFLKEVGIPFDPYFYSKRNGDNLSTAIISKLCPNIHYSYSNGVNVTFLRFPLSVNG